MAYAPDASYEPPSTVRGTLAVVAGRNESAAVYARYGARLSADGYTVGVFANPARGAVDRADAAVAWLATQSEGPRVLVGSDLGATAVLGALTVADVADGAIIAGTPVDVERVASDAERTACPVHLGVLAEQRDDPSTGSGTQEGWAPESVEGPAPADLAAITVPVLAFHGGADVISPIAASAAALVAVPDLEFVETIDGLHDALNDRSHRSVAATTVLWLEQLRAGDAHTPIVRRFAPVRDAAGALA